MIRRAAPALLLAGLLPGVAACSGGSAADGDPATPSPSTSSSTPSTSSETPSEPAATPTLDPPPVGPQYVALGDSYAAAPGVPQTSGADGCFRSSSNYAQLVARKTGLTVTDVTCSGATTESVLLTQVPEITAEAELVTVGIGGNDFDLFTRLISGCVGAAQADPEGSPCSDDLSAEVRDTLPKISDNVGRVLDAVTAAAPQARVVVVGYPVLLPATGTCPDRIPLATGDYPLVNEVTRGLSAALRTQADRLGLDFLDLSGPSRGHDVCSAEPWINGAEVAPDGTIPFHPFGIEQQAVARRIAAFL
ncbi:SGNH/GDSL hydrolase family protein [Nocardioides sp.]|uniref:SGNH/GDSL hydrolase family protein n=1 Tax=Nocardioides sp. TaxID=35761 RepID=UPI0027286929|nr:SGNH/GDSL hydrolase family protein [Nocardioides sp.]MDO9455575.1 SGNH/GDSL hydrolase family protein [Nocardioides sp.]